MPHPKNRLKLTGDTHAPDVGYEHGDDDSDVADELITSAAQPEAAMFDPAASGLPPAGHEVSAMSLEIAGGGWRDQVIARPLAALVGAFVLGYVVARIAR
jgi:hypothetical protein